VAGLLRPDPLPFHLIVCNAIRDRTLIAFDYDDHPRIAAPYCHGVTRKWQESVRAVQVGGTSRSGTLGEGKLFTLAKMKNLRPTGQRFTPDDPEYDPNDAALIGIHCRV
jgi:hypothetical protein